MKRVVITGLGVISPIGNDVNQLWRNLLEGKSGVSPIESFDTTDFAVKLGCEVKDVDLSSIPARDRKYDSRYIHFARLAAKAAYEDSGLCAENVNPDKFGVYISTSVGGVDYSAYGLNVLSEQGNRKISPFLLQAILPNMAAGKVAIDLNAKGSNMSHVAACAGGSISIGEAYLKIKNGYEDVMMAGGSDACLMELTVASFQALRAIYRGDDPKLASIPFDKRRSGFAFGEGAAILVLEELEHALNRRTKIYGEVVGYGSNCDAHHLVAPDDQHLTCAKAMKQALEQGGIEPCQVGYINAHGTSTQLNDYTEAKAIKSLFGKQHPWVSSTKGSTGHLLGAAGAIEALITVLALDREEFPYMPGYKEADPDCDLKFILDRPLSQKIEYALSNSFGFGGHNASLLFKKWEGK